MRVPGKQFQADQANLFQGVIRSGDALSVRSARRSAALTPEVRRGRCAVRSMNFGHLFTPSP